MIRATGKCLNPALRRSYDCGAANRPRGNRLMGCVSLLRSEGERWMQLSFLKGRLRTAVLLQHSHNFEIGP
jgi:hypothetical protein